MTLMGCLCAQDRYFDSETDPYREMDAGLAAGVAWYPQTDFLTADEELETNCIIGHFLGSDGADRDESEYEPAFPLTEDSIFPFHNQEDGVCTLFLGANPGSGEEVVRTASPIHHIHRNMPPLFIQHGSGDQILPMQQSVRFAMKANKVCGEERVRLQILPGAIHSSVLFETEENINKVLDFIGAAVGE